MKRPSSNSICETLDTYEPVGTNEELMSSPEPAPGDAPFFIVGSARSGTTMLRMILNSHPLVSVPPESRFITQLWRGHRDVEVKDPLAKLAANQRFELWDLPLDEVRAELGSRTRARYE